jgi:hypothetical protein
MRGAGRVVFAALLLLIAGTLSIIYGIGPWTMQTSSSTTRGTSSPTSTRWAGC